MSILKTGFIAASLCLAASFAHAGASAPMQGQMSWNNAAKSWTHVALPARSRAWRRAGTKATPFSREAMENKSGH